VGKTETENIGVDKIVKNVVASPTLCYLILAGADSEGHLAGQTLLALAENGIDEQGRVIGSTGKRPILRNVSAPEIQAFREKVQVVDMVGCEDPDAIAARIEALSQKVTVPCGCSECGGTSPISVATAPEIIATEPSEDVRMDKAGYFVIVPLADKGVINVEHYAYDNALLRVIEGTTARAIYNTIIDSGWVTELSHAAYLGKELTKAELSLENGFKYIQDGA
jgi:tetrahydromethanopterin S-methyltransferase subunit A